MLDLLKLRIARRSFFRRTDDEKAFRESAARFEVIARIVPVVIYEFRCTSAGRSFTFVSDQILELVGIRSQELLADAEAFYDLVHPGDYEELLAASTKAVVTRGRFCHEFRMVKPGGEVIWIRANSQQQGGDGVWIGYLEDVTERRQADLALQKSRQELLDLSELTEKQLIRHERLKAQQMESLCVLAGGLAHDFNNLLIGIMGNISFARTSLDWEHEAQLPLEAARKASLRAAALAHQLLTFDKGGEPVKKIFSVQRLICEVLALFLRGTNVRGEIVMPVPLHAIEADEGEMNQAFNNIVINATHAMPGGGTLTVSGSNVLLECGNTLALCPGSYVRLLFQDQGAGIPEATLEHVFDLYFTTKPDGTGFGLASTLSIVRRHGGNILVHSELGVGTTFTVYLPSTGGKV
jgi:PAS domain S-box-containing protein